MGVGVWALLVCAVGVAGTDVYDRPLSCWFAGAEYNHGAMLEHECFFTVCDNGHWDTAMLMYTSRCRCCESMGEYQLTYDQFMYKVAPSPCQYAVSQDGSSLTPATAVFTTQQCDEWGSCHRVTTFKDSGHTLVMSDDDASQVLLDGEAVFLNTSFGPVELPGDTPTFLGSSFNTSECSVVVGASRFVVKQCPDYLAVCVPPRYQGRVQGLCGNYDHHSVNDLRDRQGNVYPMHHTPDPGFFMSWKTAEQPDSQCSARESYRPVVKPEAQLGSCTLSQAEITVLVSQCKAQFAAMPGNVTAASETRFIEMCLDILCKMVEDNKSALQPIESDSLYSQLAVEYTVVNLAETEEFLTVLQRAMCNLMMSDATHAGDLGYHC